MEGRVEEGGEREQSQNIITCSDPKEEIRPAQKPISSRPKKRVVKRELT